MFKKSFGTDNQIQFENEKDYYAALGYLCRNNDATSIVWENNENQGAWGSEGRIHFYVDNPKITGYFRKTKGTGNICCRTNCNEFVENLVNNYGFSYGKTQNVNTIRNKIPSQHQSDFDNGTKIRD